MAFSSDKLRQGAAGVAGDSYSIDKSLRFNNDSSSYLSRTPASAGNRKTWTWSGWVKRGNIGYPQYLFEGGETDSNTNRMFLRFGSDDKLRLAEASIVRLDTTQLFRDPNAWYHIVLAVDTTQATASDRLKLYVNGSQITAFDTRNDLSQDTDYGINKAEQHSLGYTHIDSGWTFDGYLAEVNFIDGQALTPDNFGEFDSAYGHWKPIEYTGTYGTNGFYLPFDNVGTIHAVSPISDAQHSTEQAKIGASSLKFDGIDDYISIPDHVNWEFGTNDFTLEAWIYNTSASGIQRLFSHTAHNVGGQQGFNVFLTSNGGGRFTWSTNGTNEYSWNFANCMTQNTWTHFALTRTGTSLKVFKNGILTDSTTNVNLSSIYGGGKPLYIGTMNQSNNFNTGHFLGYIDEIRISNSTRYTSGFTPSTTAFEDDDNTLLLIHSDTTNGSTTFTDSSGVEAGLGNDQSGNANHWTTNNLAATDQMLDSPTNNFATLNPLEPNGGTLKEGNLHYSGLASRDGAKSTLQVSPNSGTWVIESAAGVASSGARFGFCKSHEDLSGLSDTGGDSDSFHMRADSGGSLQYRYNGSSSNSTHTSGTDVLGIEFNTDTDTNNVKFYINGTLDNTISVTVGTEEWAAFIYDGHGTVTTPWQISFGADQVFQTGYAEGYKTLCTDNLPCPTVEPSEHFGVVTYTGNGSTNAITGVGFQPDFLWTKGRSIAEHHCVFDAVRGTSVNLKPNLVNADAAQGKLDSFDSDGFTLSTSSTEINGNGSTYVAWCWKANGSDVLNENGTIDSQVSANQDAGFSIVSYTGNGTAGATVGHGLSKAPELVIVKNRTDADNWCVYCKTGGVIDETDFLRLDSTNAVVDDADRWNDTAATSSVFTVDTDNQVNGSSDEMIAYCFHSVEGYSKVGSYTGNGSSDGTFVYTGFRPAYVMLKKTSAAGDWAMLDAKRNTYNVVQKMLRAQGTDAEADISNSFTTDFTSNGFKCRANNGYFNASGGTYIYMAFAEYPFKYTNAR